MGRAERARLLLSKWVCAQAAAASRNASCYAAANLHSTGNLEKASANNSLLSLPACFSPSLWVRLASRSSNCYFTSQWTTVLSRWKIAASFRRRKKWPKLELCVRVGDVNAAIKVAWDVYRPWWKAPADHFLIIYPEPSVQSVFVFALVLSLCLYSASGGCWKYLSFAYTLLNSIKI